MLRALIIVVCLSVSYSVSSPVPQAPLVVAHHGFPYFYHTGFVPLIHDGSKVAPKAIQDAAKSVEVKEAKPEVQKEKVESATPSAPVEPAAPTESQSEDGSYKDDKSGDYVPDTAGDYIHDNSGDYKPEVAEIKLDKGEIVFASNPFIPAPLYPFPYYI